MAEAQRLMTPEIIDVQDDFGNTPLLTALVPSQILEPHGVFSPDVEAAKIRREETVRQQIISALLKRRASMNIGNDIGVTPLMQLAEWGYSPDIDLDFARQMIALGADVNARDIFGSTALMLAAGRGKEALVRLLLLSGADPSLMTCRGSTAHTWALERGHEQIARELQAVVELRQKE